MWILIRKEWRELRRSPGSTYIPVLAGALAVWFLPPGWAAAAATALIAAVGVAGTARRVWRERSGGGLCRLALTGISPHRLVAERVAARSVGLALEFLPLGLAVAARGGPGQPGSWAGPLALTLAAHLVLAATLGTAVGLAARRRAALYLEGLGAAAALWLAGLPFSPVRGAGPFPHAGTAMMDAWGHPAAGPGAPLTFPAMALAAVLLAAWAAPRLLDED